MCLKDKLSLNNKNNHQKKQRINLMIEQGYMDPRIEKVNYPSFKEKGCNS
jgi:hypothetical protein